MNVTAVEAAYLAGIVDGEGSISMTRTKDRGHSRYWRVVLSVASCDRELIEWLAAKWRGATLFDMDRGDGRRLQHRWTVVGHAMRQVLHDVMPYLIIKRARAEWAAEVMQIQLQRGGRAYTDVENKRLYELRARFDEDRKRSLSARKRPKVVMA